MPAAGLHDAEHDDTLRAGPEKDLDRGQGKNTEPRNRSAPHASAASRRTRLRAPKAQIYKLMQPDTDMMP